MAKNLKLKIKNAQLAEALKINKLKTSSAAKKVPEGKAAAAEEEKHKKEVKTPSLPVKEAKPVAEAVKKIEKKKVIEKEPLKKEEKPALISKAAIKPETAAKPETTVEKKAPILEEEEEAKAKAGFRRTLGKDFRDLKAPKKLDAKGFDSRARHGLAEIEEGAWRHKRRPKQKKIVQAEEIIRPKHLKVKLPISIKDLAQAMKLKASELISKLLMQGIGLTLNDYLDDETTVQLLGEEFGCTIEIDTSEEERLRITDKTIQEEIKETPPEKLKLRPPVVAFMGHVDHGKTSLIDAIRKTDLVSKEAGAITQHIGAFKCHMEQGEITILDTPGHEAFSEMRKRGASVTDLVILVIAGDEGIKRQTEEAIQKAKDAHVPILVAINKCDKPGFNAENVYRQLADHELLPEIWGGATITINCSALTGEGIKDLLEMILLQAEVSELKANPKERARGTVLESELHKGLGITATLLVQNGTLKTNDAFVIAQIYGRIKTMYDEHGKVLHEALPSTSVKVTGLSDLPTAGTEFIVVGSEKEAKKLSEERQAGREKETLKQSKKALDLILQKETEKGEKKILNVIIRADVQGSLEAIKQSLKAIASEKVELNFLYAGIGEITESDVDLASISNATILGFHTKMESHAETLCKQKKVPVVLRDIIYHLVDEVKKAMQALLEKIREEREVSTTLVKAVFRSSQLGLIAGCHVQEGTINRNHYVKVFRNEEKIWEGSIASLKRVKEDVKEVGKGLECGIVFTGFSSVEVGDVVKSYEIHYLEQTL